MSSTRDFHCAEQCHTVPQGHPGKNKTNTKLCTGFANNKRMMCIATLSLRRLAEALNNAVFSSPYRSIKIKQGKNTKGNDQLKVSQSNEMQDYKTYYCSLSYFIVVIIVYYMK